MESNVLFQAHSVGVGDHWPLWSVAPEGLGQRILDVAKRAARFVKKVSPDTSHSACLEVVARGAGLPNWHTLHAQAQALIDDFHPDRHWPRPKGAHERAAALAPAFPMLAQARDGCPPTAEQERGMRLFAERLGATEYLSPDTALAVVARMNGADTWDALIKRRPEDSTTPLYRFAVAHDGGRFIWSAACDDLVDQLDDHYQDYWSRSDSERARSRDWVEEITARRSDFLEGLLAKADMLEHPRANTREAGRVYADALSKAHDLMQEGFEGLVPWGYVENRFYHRLLFCYMRWNIFYGSKSRAIDLARKQLRLNPNDDLGLRYFRPVLLASAGRLSAAHKAFGAFKDDAAYDGQAPFVRSLVFSAMGRRQDAAREMLHALFVFPALRDVIVIDGPEPVPEIAPGTQRVAILDREALGLQLAAISLHPAAVESSHGAWVNHPDVVIAERELGALFKRDAGWQPWLNAVMERATSLAAILEPGATVP